MILDRRVAGGVARCTASIAHDFFSYGVEGIAVHHSTRERLAKAEARLVIGRFGPVTLRQRIGVVLISFGTLVAGTPARIQVRHAPVHAPDTRSELASLR
jgi:hypothetical protein